MLKVPLVLAVAFSCTLTMMMMECVKNDAQTSNDPPPTYAVKLSIFLQVNKMRRILKRSISGKKKTKVKDVYKSMALLFLLLLAISCDVESNPGPTKANAYLEGDSTVFPCGNCNNPVTWDCKGVQCDMCEIWYHADCQNIRDSLYDRLGDSIAGTAVWKCLNCKNINITSGIPPSLDSLDSENPYAPLSSPDISELSFSATRTSTPKQASTKPCSSKGKKNNIKRSLKVQVINCRSVVDKKLEFNNLVTSTKPDIVIGTESWLKPKHFTSEIFDPDLGYTIYRRDRVGQAGGGVFIAIRDCITAREMPDMQSSCEDLWIKIDLVGSKSLVIGAYYRPHENDRDSFEAFRGSLEKVTKKHSNIWDAGDLNLPKMNWDRSAPQNDCKYPSLYREIANTFTDANLTQMVNLPTRENNILDLFLTTNPTLVNNVNILPGISDHNIAEIKVNTSARICYQKPRNIPLYRNANWTAMKQGLTEFIKD